jgi:hypothetical protein
VLNVAESWSVGSIGYGGLKARARFGVAGEQAPAPALRFLLQGVERGGRRDVPGHRTSSHDAWGPLNGRLEEGSIEWR